VELEVLNNKHGRGLSVVKQQTCSNALRYCWAKEQNLFFFFLFIFFKLFMYFCLLLIYKNNKKKEKE
jgi:hypothetical protein